MASANTLCKKILNVKTAVVEDQDFYQDMDGVSHLRIKARPNRWHEHDCPFCHKRCQPYDVQTKHPRTWRALDWGGVLVEIVILSRLVDTFSSRILYPMLLLSVNHSIAVV